MMNGIPCPKCRHKTVLKNPYRPPEEWVNELCKAHFVLSLLDDLKQPDQETCYFCKENGLNTSAKHWCKSCEIALCPGCGLDHSPGHKVVGISEIDVKARNQKKSKCPKHPHRMLELFCEDHGEALCHTCNAVSHRSCKLVELSVAVDSLKKDIRGRKTENEKIKETERQVITNCKAQLNTLNDSQRKAEDALKELREQLIQIVLEKEQELLDEMTVATNSERACRERRIESSKGKLSEFEKKAVVLSTALDSPSEIDVFTAYKTCLVEDKPSTDPLPVTRLELKSSVDSIIQQLKTTGLGQIKITKMKQ